VIPLSIALKEKHQNEGFIYQIRQEEAYKMAVPTIKLGLSKKRRQGKK